MGCKRSFCRARLASSLALILCLTVFDCLQAFSSTPKVAPASAPVAPQQSDPSMVGKWSEFATWDITPVHISLLPNGKVLFWSRDKTADGKNAVGNSKAYVWDPASTSVWNPTLGTRTLFSNNTTNVFCTGHSFLPDGRLLVTGGHGDPDYDGIGEKHSNVFNFSNNTWLKGPDMNKGRWYPFNVTLGNGETLVMSGAYWDGTFQGGVPNRVVNRTPQIFSAQGNWRDLTQQSQDVPNYPWLYIAPGGKVFVSGPQLQSYYLNPTGAGSWTFVASSNYFHDIGGSSVMYAPGKIMNVGGYSNFQGVTRGAEIIDLNSASPAWSTVASMSFSRINHTTTVLPDGKVLVFGGSQCVNAVTTNAIDCTGGAVFEPELWDPNNPNMMNPLNTWTKMASPAPNPATGNQVPRLYHSIAILLPDARVLVGGGGLPAADGENTGGVAQALYGHNDVQIFSPPYLFSPGGAPATRPVINSTPPSISYGQTFFVGTTTTLTNAKVSLVRLPSVTHGFNQDQRVIFLNPPTNVAGGLNVVAPVNGDLCPPGYYMLFVLNSNGVPSVAKIIKVQQDDGYQDGADCNQVWGWAWDRNFPNTPVNVDIYDGSSAIALNVPANVFRQDLLNANKGNGYHAFAYNLPPSVRDGQMHYINVRFAGTNNYLNSSPRYIICGGALFPTQVPTSTATGAGSTWEQATQFISSVSGKITHIRFYKASGEMGSHIGRIWSDTGVQLAQVAFTGETPSGWQTQALTTQLQISAGVKYRVSYNINNLVAKTPNGLITPVTNGPLTALGAFYSTPAGTFPTTGSTSNLFADILFTAP